MKHKLLIAMFTWSLFGLCVVQAEGPPEMNGLKLFDGKTFTGWEGNLKWFRIEDEAIVAGTTKEKIPNNEFLTTTRAYSDFQLRLKCKLVKNIGNAGIQVRSKRIPNHHEMIGYQADIAKNYWGCLYDESRRRKFMARPTQELIDQIVKPDDWNAYVIRCEGKRVRLWLNGTLTVDYTEEDDSLEQKGLIGLQIHGGPPSEIHYKDIELEDLSKESHSLFNGKDLQGWHVDVPALDKKPDGKVPFIVRDGMLVSLGNPNGHLITDAQYQNYRIETEYRFAGKAGNCGVLVHASRPRALYKMFPASIEAQMFSGNAGDFWCIQEDIKVPNMASRRGPEKNWGVSEGKGRRIHNLTDGSENPVGEWNRMVVECLDREVKVWVNGDLVNHGTECTANVGQIALQAEGAEVEFRKVLLTPIKNLSETAPKG